ncbi:hypothetical protein RFI_22157 [Reticulomyxa filosa]|uniref:Uncharacterized protein n=1 Tax=Reticulomyxa filosa TaxID=46433 RepID=X6MMG6_RETFI|nr:hypothetical protein RFI_22157 [Reticulomyxa filosa]|eukprot:ETO15208.1 hypothetical protein RFI_22157 [Reticulomyxa filosa]
MLFFFNCKNFKRITPIYPLITYNSFLLIKYPKNELTYHICNSIIFASFFTDSCYKASIFFYYVSIIQINILIKLCTCFQLFELRFIDMTTRICILLEDKITTSKAFREWLTEEEMKKGIQLKVEEEKEKKKNEMGAIVKKETNKQQNKVKKDNDVEHCFITGK